MYLEEKHDYLQFSMIVHYGMSDVMGIGPGRDVAMQRLRLFMLLFNVCRYGMRDRRRCNATSLP